MNDYKELLGDINDCLIAQPSGAVCKRVLREAADAIEQLCADVERLEAENRAKEQYIAETIGKVIKERDEWKTLGSLANKRAEDYREMRRQRDKAIKERDAAVSGIHPMHGNCKFRDCNRKEFPCVDCLFLDRWEWCGVQKESE